MSEDGETGSNEQKAVAKGRGSLAINAAQYANVTVYQYVTYAGDRVAVRETIDPSRCPYPGLETFRTSEAKYFAGREDDVAELEVKLRDHDICGVIAASGAGKSSLVHAGLIPALANRETEAWDVFAFKPGQEPLYGLARSMSGVLAEAETRRGQFDEIDATVADLRETPGRLRRYIEEIIGRRADAADGKRHHVLIFVDQWEELYTRENDQDRDTLVRELMDVAERGLAKVILTMRIDFMDDLVSKSTEFYDVLEPAVRILRPLSETGRRAAIEGPAKVAGLGVPPELTSRLVTDLGKEEGTLPYLQFVLRQLWEKRDKETNSLTTATYDSMDGLKGAIGAHADDVFRKLSKEEQGLAQRVLPRLANVSDIGITSRRLPFADFDEPARKLLRRLAEPDARLIVLSSATEDVSEAEIVAEVAHEALLDDWKTLSQWIADRKDFFRLRNKLEADAKTWVEKKHRHDFLIPAGKPLLEAADLQNDALDGEISEDLGNYLNISFWKDRSRRWTRIGVFAVLLLTAIGIAMYFANLSGELQASNQELVAQTEAEASARFRSEVRLAGRLATNGTTEAWEVLTQATGDFVQVVGQTVALEAMDADVLTVALQALINQRVFVVEGTDEESGELLGFMPDGTTLLISQKNELDLIDARTGLLRAQVTGLGPPILIWNIGAHRIGMIVCAEDPCLLGTAVAAHSNNGVGFWETYLEYHGQELRDSPGESEYWEILENFPKHIQDDIDRRKLRAVVVDVRTAKSFSGPLLSCLDSFCIGKSEGRMQDFDFAYEDLDALAAIQDETSIKLPLRVDRGLAYVDNLDFASQNLSDVPPSAELDPNWDTTVQYFGPNGLVVRASPTSALIEFFRKNENGAWEQNSICLEPDEELGQCAGGLIGTRILDISADGRLVLATSYNQGTGGGVGEQQTVLVSTLTGQTVWRKGTVLRQAAFANDNSTFATIDWLGTLEVRSVEDFGLIYKHGNSVQNAIDGEALIYHPELPIAAVVEENGTILLLDLTPPADLGMTTRPLRSMRGMCRPVGRGPFRTILPEEPRTLNDFDWSWVKHSGEHLDGSILRVPSDEMPLSNREIQRSSGEKIVFIENDLRIEFENLDELLVREAPEVALTEYLRFNIATDNDTIVIWDGNQTVEVGSEYIDQTETNWAVVSGGEVTQTGVSPEPPSWRERTALSVDNEVFAQVGPECSLKIMRLATQEEVWSETLAFSLNADVEILPAEELVIVLSYEWYGAQSVQLFDLKTGAAGPWLNIVESSWSNIDQPSGSADTSELQEDYFVRVPPWGGRLRSMLLDAALAQRN